MRPRIPWLTALGFAVLALNAARWWRGRSGRAGTDDTADFGAFLRERGEHAGVFLSRRDSDGRWTVEEERNADAKFPLASVRKVLVLCTLSEAVHEGRIDPEERVPLAAVRRYRLPGTDGGAYRRAYGRTPSDALISVRECADAMISASCNASTEYLWRQVGGGSATAALARRHAMTAQDPVPSGYGEFVATSVPFALRAVRCPADELAGYYDRIGERPRRWHRLLPFLPSGGLGPRALRRTCAGTPREWVGLFQAVVDSPAEGAPLSFARAVLSWPMRDVPGNAEVYQDVLAKGGSLPGTLTQVYAVRPPAGGAPAVMAVFLKELDAAQRRSLVSTPVWNDHMVRALTRS
ncbi:serine hydrolase [Streptantibioticus ferralitis]|uniref:Serine hydrolase n=1 Tax=Streptantibioticus ferralitis TaxID=236510 RepID=A0ABT5Z6X0_9ACTN|nr:serine hydrolase [Streptantibioticus ferralitis]MDF2259397.1 serine hydrolase [Streptantibioticus ferralitis]